jgi:cell division protein FtsI/penicillin-binding protein 2
MQYQHPDWFDRQKRNAWKKYAGWAVVLLLVIAGAILLPGLWKGARIALPGSSSPTPRETEAAYPTPVSPEPAARAYLDGWQSKNYSNMYSLLSSESRDAMSEKDFTDFYEGVERVTTLRSLEYSLSSVDMTPTNATVQFEVRLHTILVGDIAEQTRMLLVKEDGQWRVIWDGQTVLPELENGNRLVMHREYPARGDILDRNGLALAADAEVTEIGVVPEEITDEDAVLARLSSVLRMPRETIRRKYADAPPTEYVPIGEANAADIAGGPDSLDNLGGVQVRTSTRRYYYGGGVGSHVVGYTSRISAALLEEYRSLGYDGSESVGATGLERSAEPELAGREGGTLWVTSSDGTHLQDLAGSDPQPGMSLHTTLDRDLQAQIERTVMGPYNGAVVVLSRNTGEVLAMASSKTFDSNLFTPGSFNGSYLVGDVLNDPDGPLTNRATNGQYPLGSVFKIVTMAAGLESGLFTANTVYDDATGTYTGADGILRTDWTVEKEMKPHGELTLEQCLVQSCNPCFWNVGETLWRQDPARVPNMAKAFGLGSVTGIPGLDELPGRVPGPDDGDWTVTDALNQAVGQGDLLVTPLQVADFIAAVGNGGTLYRPQVILSIGPPDGDPVFSFAPVVRGQLPVNAANLEVIQRAMRGVIYDPKGTARPRFTGISDVYKIAGKTGTAESGIPDEPHAWFAAYTFNEGAKADIAVAVIAEYAGEGSTYAARMVRRVMEIYFFGRPATLYPWESEYGVRATDTPTETMEPTPTFTPGESQ